MLKKSILIQNQDAAHALIAKPSPTWTDADILSARGLLDAFNEIDHPAAPFDALEQAMAAAPIAGFPAAYAKARWFTDQPMADEDCRQDWEPAAIKSLQDFLSPKDDFVAELGLRTGQIIRRARLADAEFNDPHFHAAIRELEATDELIEASAATSLQGVTTQLVVAMGHLENLRVMTESNEAEVAVQAEDIREFVERTKGLLDAAVPVLTRIAGIDLQADLSVDYRAMSITKRQPSDEAQVSATVEIPVNPWAQYVADYTAAPAEWWNDDRLRDAVKIESHSREWIDEQCEARERVPDEMLNGMCEPVERLMDAILAAPVEGVVGARAKLSLLTSERRNILEPEEVQDALEIILRGLEQSEPSSKAGTLKEAA